MPIRSYLTALASVFQSKSEKNQANGYPGLDNSGKLNLAVMPAGAVVNYQRGATAVALNNGNGSVTFPTPFSAVPVVVGNFDPIGTGTSCEISNITTTGFSVRAMNVAGDGFTTTATLQWVAVL